ncbi:MAG: 4-hydroxy-tetrahydrodipicolinate reductase [Thermoanaerobaculia bacterium]
MRALIVGYGKMGKAIEAALAAKGHVVAGKIDEGDRLEKLLEGEPPGVFLEGESGGSRSPSASGKAAAADKRGLQSPPSKKSSGVDVAFEFTTPTAAESLVVSLLSKKIPVVSGTTGWDITRALQVAKERKTPLLHSPNFSIGVAVMRRLAAQAAALLAPFSSFEPGILERHHSAKKDSPSGTAKLLASAVESSRGGARVPVVALRQGGQPGEHVLFFEGEGESIEIVHRARSRAIFASGAVTAAEWLCASGRTGPVTFDEFLDSISRGRTS